MSYFASDYFYEIREIEAAFKRLCLDKLREDGYIDMHVYIEGKISKKDMQMRLSARNSQYTALYKDAYPKDGVSAFYFWQKHYGEHMTDAYSIPRSEELTYEDSEAIVYWVYKVIGDRTERESFTKRLFYRLEAFRSVIDDIDVKNGVFYDPSRVKVNFCSSVAEAIGVVISINKKGSPLFFRGHGNPNYRLQPSVARSKTLAEKESCLYKDILIECPDDFEKCHTHFEKLVKMQHYGLPTRMLDITRNPLVALYFACEGDNNLFGELILIAPKQENIKYPQSDAVSVLASLPAFSHMDQGEFYTFAKDSKLTEKDFNKKIERLIQEVRLEKPAFREEIKQGELLKNYVVYAPKNNPRIARQDGAFIIRGLEVNNAYGCGKGSLNDFRLKKEDGKTVVMILSNKKNMLEDLEKLSITKASLFPEIECVAEYLKEKYI